MLRLILIILCFSNISSKILYGKDNIYIFGGLGYSNYEINNSDITEINNKITGLGFATSSTTYDSKNFSYEYGIGLDVLELFVLEASYLDLGQVSLETNTTGPSETLTTDIDIEGISLDLVRNIGPLGFTRGFLKIDDDIKVYSSLGNTNVPVDDLLLPRLGANIIVNNYRFEINRTFLSPNSHLNNFMISYIFNLF